jgi:ribosomal protein S17E
MDVVTKKIKGSLMEEVLDFRNIHLAYLRSKNNYMNREVQNFIDVNLFEKSIPNLYENIYKLLTGQLPFEFKPLEVLNKPKKKEENTWKTRQIVRMNFFDAVIAQCFINVLADKIKFMLPTSNMGYKLNPIYSENMYQFWKYDYKKFVNKEIELSSNDKYTFVVEADIENFYPEIDKNRLFNELKVVLSDDPEDEFFNWIYRILNLKGTTEKGEILELTGLPQGPLFSPLLALFYIRTYLDTIKKTYPNVIPFGYVDDIRVYCETEEEAKTILTNLASYMEHKGLKLNKNKSDVFPVGSEKRLETKIMGKASNLDRAIRDEVILSSNGKKEMRSRLKFLLKELAELYETDDKKKEKLEDRLSKFVNYRYIMLLDDDIEEWKKHLNEFTDVSSLQGNFIAMWHALYLNATTFRQKRMFIEALEKLLEEEELQELNYVKFVIYSYIFRWSPGELKFSIKDSTEKVEKYIKSQEISYSKAILSNLHQGWIPFIKDLKLEFSKDDGELTNLLYSLNLCATVEDIYLSNVYERTLHEKDGSLIHYANTFHLNTDYLKTEKIKNIQYKLFDNHKGNWTTKFDKNSFQLNELTWKLNDSKGLLTSIFKWLNFQLEYSESRIPSSVVNPDYIYVDPVKDIIYLYGNPAEKNDVFYYQVNTKAWRESFTRLFEVMFNVSFNKGLKTFLKESDSNIFLWQYRILRKLASRIFKLEDFVKFTINVLKTNSETKISSEQYSVDHLLEHYITDFNHQDNLLLIGEFVENSWKNGAKETNFYTLHNHEHARYLIFRLHEIFEKSYFSIFLNSKESFRLFSACYLHDIGMLSAPNVQELNEEKKEEVVLYVKGILDRIQDYPKFPHVIDIHSEFEKVREAIVRDNHPLISERELVGDYPALPLTVAERRDIGIISSAHGKEKSDIDLLSDNLHDGFHPIRLKLCSLLLRIADLSDVSKERVRQEVLERNFERMGNESVFHWVKHLSVDNLTIESAREEDINDPTIIKIIINHNFLPYGLIEKEKLQAKCSHNCKLCLKDNGLVGEGQEGFFLEGIKTIKEVDGTFKYFDATNCNLTCAFVNKAYNWFFAEIIYMNKYFREKKNNIEVDLSIRLNESNSADFYYVKNRKERHSAQEFFHNFFA